MSNKKYNYLIRKNKILEGGLKDSVDANSIITFDNMDIKHSTTENVDTDTLTLVSEKAIDEKIKDGIATFHHSIVGAKKVADLTAMNVEIANFNKGDPITLDSGEYNDYDSSKAVVGEIIEFIPSSSNGFLKEQASVDTGLKMTLLTHNNDDQSRFVDIETVNTTQHNDIELLKIADTEFVKKDNTEDITGLGQIDPMVAETTNADKMSTREEVRSVSNSIKVELETDVTALKNKDIDLESRVVSLEASGTAAQFATAFRKWTGTLDATNNPAAGDNTATFDLSGLTADDGNSFTFGAMEDLTIWLKGSLNGVELELNALVQAGRTTPQLVEIIRATNGNSVEVLTLFVDNTGKVTISRNQGTELDMSSLKIEEVSETILSKTSGLVTQADLAAETAARVAADNLKQNSVDTSLPAGAQSIIGSINKLDTKTINNEADIAELNLGKFDVNGDGTKITEIFNANGDIFTENSQNLLVNDQTSTDTAHIGHGYKGEINIGASSQSLQLGEGGQGVIELGLYAGASSRIRIGNSAEGRLEIGSDKWVPNDGQGKLIHGAESATIQDIIEVANAAKYEWLDITSTLDTRVWTTADVGKTIRVTGEFADGTPFTTSSELMNPGGTEYRAEFLLHIIGSSDNLTLKGLWFNEDPLKLTEVDKDYSKGTVGITGNKYTITKFEIHEAVQQSGLFGKFANGASTTTQTGAAYDKSQSDAKEVKIRTDFTAGDLTTLASAKTYTDTHVSSSIGATFTENSDKLVANDKTSTASASIGYEYKGDQNYGLYASGSQEYGQGATGSQSYGQDSSGGIGIGQNSTGTTHIHQDATGGLYIGSNKVDDNSMQLISGSHNASFKDIINTTTKQGILDALGYEEQTITEYITATERYFNTQGNHLVIPDLVNGYTFNKVIAVSNTYETNEMVGNYFTDTRITLVFDNIARDQFAQVGNHFIYEDNGNPLSKNFDLTVTFEYSRNRTILVKK